MAKCYRCDMCGVVTILAEYNKVIDFDEDMVSDPEMNIYYKQEVYDICPNCAKKVINFVKKKGQTE